MSGVGLIILAAGASTRMGTPKQLLQYRQQSLIHYVIEQAIASVCRPVIVVLGANAERIIPAVELLDACIVENLQWSVGMSTSIAVGIEALNEIKPDVEAVVLMLCDQPFVTTQTINQLVEVYQSTGKHIVASEYAEIWGVPALFNRSLFSKLNTLSGEAGARQVIAQDAQEVFSIPFPEGATDLDTPKEYEEFQSMTS